MPLEDILTKIKAQATAQAEAIVSDADEKAKARIAKAAEEASNLAAKRLDEALSVINRDKAIALARAETERRQAVLREKQRLVASVFEEALKELASMPDAEYRGFLAKAIAKAMTGGEEVMLGSADEARLGPEFLNMLKSELKAQGKPEDVSVSYGDSVRGGGFIVKQGGLSLNLAFPAIMQRLLDELEIEVARCLFSE